MRKKIMGIALAIMVCGLTACANTNGKNEIVTEAPTKAEETTPEADETQKEELTTEAATEETTTEDATTEAETMPVEETDTEEVKTTAAESTAATSAATTAATTAAATAATTQAGTLGANPYVYRGGYELETDPTTGKLVVDANGYYTKLGLQKPLTVKKNESGGTRIDVYGAEPGPYFIIDVASYSSLPTLTACTLGEGERDPEAKLVNAWWDEGKKLNVVLWCKQCPVNCLYVLDLSGYTSQIKEKEEEVVTKREVTVVFKYSDAEKYEFKVEAISKTLTSSTATAAQLTNLTEDDTYYYFDLTSTETGDFRAKYNKSTGKITLEL